PAAPADTRKETAKPAAAPKLPAKAEPMTLTPQALAAARVEAARKAPFDRSRYEIVRSIERLNTWISRGRDLGAVAIDTETTSLDPMQAALCGFSLALAPNEAC